MLGEVMGAFNNDGDDKRNQSNQCAKQWGLSGVGALYSLKATFQKGLILFPKIFYLEKLQKSIKFIHIFIFAKCSELVLCLTISLRIFHAVGATSLCTKSNINYVSKYFGF